MAVEGILNSIRALGYAVSVHHMMDYVEMHAVDLKHPENQFIARDPDSDDEDATVRCATLLAEMVGIDLEGS